MQEAWLLYSIRISHADSHHLTLTASSEWSFRYCFLLLYFFLSLKPLQWAYKANRTRWSWLTWYRPIDVMKYFCINVLKSCLGLTEGRKRRMTWMHVTDGSWVVKNPRRSFIPRRTRKPRHRACSLAIRLSLANHSCSRLYAVVTPDTTDYKDTDST